MESSTRYSSPASAEWLRNLTNLSVKCPLDLNAKVQRQQRKRRQREKTGPRCVFLAGKPVQRPGLLAVAETSPLSTNSTRKTAKAPAFTSPRLLLERNFVFDCLVEAPGLEPGSKEGLNLASTKRSLHFISRLADPYRQGSFKPARILSSSRYERVGSSNPAKMTPGSGPAGLDRSDGLLN